VPRAEVRGGGVGVQDGPAPSLWQCYSAWAWSTWRGEWQAPSHTISLPPDYVHRRTTAVSELNGGARPPGYASHGASRLAARSATSSSP